MNSITIETIRKRLDDTMSTYSSTIHPTEDEISIAYLLCVIDEISTRPRHQTRVHRGFDSAAPGGDRSGLSIASEVYQSVLSTRRGRHLFSVEDCEKHNKAVEDFFTKYIA